MEAKGRRWLTVVRMNDGAEWPNGEIPRIIGRLLYVLTAVEEQVVIDNSDDSGKLPRCKMCTSLPWADAWLLCSHIVEVAVL